ncbi:Uncharacterised protein [Vibrio cholerae]|nr:Uncharacterised protein [Vibrio cholerae]
MRWRALFLALVHKYQSVHPQYRGSQQTDL